MVNRFYGGNASSRNCDRVPNSSSSDDLLRCDDPGSGSIDAGSVRQPDIALDLQVRILARVEQDGGETTLGDIADALPDQPWPISAVWALADDGLLALDLAAPFDASMRVRRIVA